MNYPSSSLTLAVDGGGTRCRIALARDDQITQVETGAANVSTNFDQAVTEIYQGLEQLAGKTGLTLATLSQAPAYLGLAGVISAKIATRLAEALPLVKSQIEDDRSAALRGALGDVDGAIAHCGTGSFLASQIKGQRRIIGGWGPILGDQASAQWLGRQALSRVLDVADGLAAPSALSATILASLQNSAGIVAFASTASPTDFGDLAKEVTHHAQNGDTLAVELMYLGADYIAARLPQIGWASGARLCLTGGLAPQYASYLPQRMQDALTPPQGDPLTGALALAREFAAKSTAEGRK